MFHPSRSSNNYISPSDEIMSPCTAKLSAMRNKQVGKYAIALAMSLCEICCSPFLSQCDIMLTMAFSPSHRVKPKSLFAQASTKRLGQGSSLFGCEATPPASASPTKE